MGNNCILVDTVKPALAMVLLFLPMVISGYSTAQSDGALQVTEPISPSPTTEHVAISGELAVLPEPESWVNDPRTPISVEILDDTFDPVLETLILLLDDQPLVPDWDAGKRTLTGKTRESMNEGPHSVEVSLGGLGFRLLTAEWSFTLDSVPPRVELGSFNPRSEMRSLNVNGTYIEENLKEIKVNGFTAIAEEGTFRVQVLLWPGNNRVQAVAHDHSNNRGFSERDVVWLPSASQNETNQVYVHVNGSFLVTLPVSWEVREDYEFESGLRGDILAAGPTESGISSTLTIVSRFTRNMNEGLFLGLMENTLLTIGEAGRVVVVSQPRLVDLEARALSAQFSVLDILPSGSRAFVMVTGFWSNALGRVWLMVASLPVESVERDWHAVQVAFESFSVVEPIGPPEQPAEPPQVSIDRAVMVTVATTLFLVAFFFVVFYLKRREGHGGPP